MFSFQNIEERLGRNVTTVHTCWGQRRWRNVPLSPETVCFLDTLDITPGDMVWSAINYDMMWTTPELAPSSPNYHTTPMGGRLSSREI
ncbi:hypothetical protein TNCV_1868871 [Trichonephila clavipes]|nr:hypothetical protein TNCV_1868871 [Trichonephila clavipes]